MQNNYIAYTEISRHLGLSPSDSLLIGCDLMSLALQSIRNERQFDIDKFINSFQEVLYDGTLLIPAYINDLKKYAVIDLAEIEPETGSLSVAAFKRKDFIRTQDPLHSFLVWGKDAIKLQNIKNKSTFGKDSVFGYLFETHGKMLLIDIPIQLSFTYVHFVEEQVGVKYRKFKNIKYRLKKADSIVEESLLYYAKKPGYLPSLNCLENEFLDNNIMQVFTYNACCFKVIDLDKAYYYIADKIKFDSNFKLASFSWLQFFKDIMRLVFK